MEALPQGLAKGVSQEMLSEMWCYTPLQGVTPACRVKSSVLPARSSLFSGLWTPLRFLARWNTGLCRITVLFPTRVSVWITSKDPRVGIRIPWSRRERPKG